MVKNKFILFILIYTFIIFTNHAQDLFLEKNNIIELDFSKMPEIKSIKPSRNNDIFNVYQEIIENNNKLISSGKAPEYMFFKYTNTEDFSFQGLSARCCISQDTIATLNGIGSSQEKIKNKTLILPTVNGLFIPVDKCNNSLEQLLHDNYKNKTLTNKEICFRIGGEDYLFFLNKKFSPTERAYFLDSSLCLPLDIGTYWVSSEFGKRKNPLSGKIKNHNGIDLAAPIGTPVYAIKDGTASCCIYGDKEFGNYIILSHDMGKMTSVYAHLSEICVAQSKSVKKGDIIGYVGETGMATGPHLHFEIRQNGIAQNPRSKLKLDNK